MKNNNLLTLLILSLFCVEVSAGTKTYKIELMVFSQNMPNTEKFDQIESLIEWPGKILSLDAYKKVSSENMSLKGNYARMARSRNYQPLMHVAWIQSAYSNSLSRAVKITNSEGTVDGFFRLQRGNLVHMIVDLEYSAGSVIYRLNEKRRFKLNETHYFDHPKFGALIRVSPVE